MIPFLFVFTYFAFKILNTDWPEFFLAAESEPPLPPRPPTNTDNVDFVAWRYEDTVEPARPAPVMKFGDERWRMRPSIAGGGIGRVVELDKHGVAIGLNR